MRFGQLKMPSFGGNRQSTGAAKDPIGAAFSAALTQKISAGEFELRFTPTTQPVEAQPQQESDWVKLAAVLAGQPPRQQPQSAQLPPQPEPNALPPAAESRPSMHERLSEGKKARRQRK